MPPTAEANICNQALARVGQRQFINALTDTSASGLLCAVLYPAARDAVLSRRPWPFATKHATLVALGASRSGWAFAYTLPADCLYPRYVYSGARPGSPAANLPGGISPVFGPITNVSQLPALNGVVPQVEFEIEANDAGDGQILLTDQADAELVYTQRVTNPAAIPQLVVDAITARLAADLALSLAVKPQLVPLLTQQAEAAFLRAWARELNARQGDPQPDSQFIAVRG